jgi:hypothetical protein
LRGDEVEGTSGERKAQGSLSKVLYTSHTSIKEPPLVVSQNSSPARIQIPYPLADTSSPHLVDPGPLNPAAWSQWLTHHPDRAYAQTLVDIINHGAKIGYTGPDQTILSRNLTSANESPATLSADIQTQLRKGQLGKLSTLPPKFISSPLGLVPKSDATWRRIHHLSHPRGNSVNDHIPPEWGTLTYSSFDQALRLVAEAGTDSILVKRDLADAFRHIPVSPQDWWLLGFQWDDAWWYDKFLPFGLRTSPFIFDLFSSGLNWILQNELGWAGVLHYLDDFLAVLAPHLDATRYAEDFDSLCKDLGFTVKQKKSYTGTCTDFLGLEIDTAAMEARLPSDKHAKALLLVRTYLRRRSLTLWELQSVIGFLSFAAKVVPLGRPFLRRLYNALSGYSASPHSSRRPVTPQMKEDLRWWLAFLPQWSGVSIIRPTREEAFVWTDAAGKKGIGGYLLEAMDKPLEFLRPEHAFSARIPRHFRKKHINAKEMMAALKAIELWGPQLLEGKRLCFFIDNTAVVGGLTKHSIRGEAMAPLRKLLLLAAAWDIELVPRWIPSHENTLADALSRHEWRKIANISPMLTQATLRTPLRSPKTPLPIPQTAGTATCLSSAGQLPATFGGALARTLARPTTPQDAATQPMSPSTNPTHAPSQSPYRSSAIGWLPSGAGSSREL